MEDSRCRGCKTGVLKRFLSLGNVPPVNAFLENSEIPKEKAYPLNLAYCTSCLLVQLEEIVSPEELFCNYLHLSSSSTPNVAHLKDVANLLNSRFKINPETKILEIGSNDGTLLAFLKNRTDKVLGIDPAKNLVEMNKQLGVEMIPEFFNTTTAAEILKTRGSYDLIVALNVIPHTPDVVNLLEGVHLILSPKGTLVMEGAYALETILKGEFDTIYHEHVYSFSLHALISTFKQAGLKVVDVQKIPTQGGSLRIFAQREKEADEPSHAVRALLQEEKNLGLIEHKIYDNVESKVVKFREELRKLIEQEKKSKGKLIGLGAPARGVVIMNYCNVGTEDIEMIIDDTPLKQGRFSPGMHIPVTSWDSLKPGTDKTFFLFAWTYREHFLSKIREKFPNSRVIIPFPNLEVKVV